jgi:hypothetical protein
MTRKEVGQLLALMTTAWPKFKAANEAEHRQRIDVWAAMFADDDFSLCVAALKRLMVGSPFPPSIHDLRKQIYEVQHPDTVDAATAWGLVADAIRWYGWYDAQGGMTSLPERVRKVVHAIGWRELCEGKADINRAQFMRMYETVSKREQELQMLPASLKEDIKRLGDGMKVKELEA